MKSEAKEKAKEDARQGDTIELWNSRNAGKPDSYYGRSVSRKRAEGKEGGEEEFRRILIVSPLLNRGSKRTPLSHLSSRHAAGFGFARGMCTSTSKAVTRLLAFLAPPFFFFVPFFDRRL